MPNENSLTFRKYVKEKSPLKYASLREMDFITLFCVEHIDSEYFTFLLGFLSSMAIEDIHTFFDTTIRDDLYGFYILIGNIILLSAICVVCLRFIIKFSDFQKRVLSHMTTIAQYNYVLENFEKCKKSLEGLSRHLCLILIFLLLLVALNTAKFLFVNFAFCSPSPTLSTDVFQCAEK